MARNGNGGARGSQGKKSVFFSNVPYTTTAGYLRKIFAKVGRVEDLELYTDGRGGSIGAGVVTFDSAAAAPRAVGELHDVEVDGRPMLVKLDERESRAKGLGESNPETTVFFNGVPYDTTEGFLRAKFERSGRIIDFNLWRRPDGSSQGMGTCEYSTPGEAEGAILNLNGAVVDGRRLLVQMDKRPEQSAEGGAKEVAYVRGGAGGPRGNNWGGGGSGKGVGKRSTGKGYAERRVFWSNVPTTTTEGYLRAQFEQVGTIVDFDFWRQQDGTSLGKGVCEFDHYLGAWRAHERLHGVEIDGRTLLVKNDDGGRDGWLRGKGKATGGKARGGKGGGF